MNDLIFEDIFAENSTPARRTLLKQFRQLIKPPNFADLTTETLNQAGFKATKVIVTVLQPLHLDERYFPLRGPRLFARQVVNRVPHFFL